MGDKPFYPNYAWVGAPATFNSTNPALGGNSRKSSTCTKSYRPFEKCIG